MPLAQAFRYFWAVQKWQLQASLQGVFVGPPVYPAVPPATTITTATVSLDTGFGPFPAGYDEEAGGWKSLAFTPPGKSPDLAARMTNVMLNLLTAYDILFSAPVTVTDNIGDDETLSEAFGLRIALFLQSFDDEGALNGPELLWDDAIPGNVFLGMNVSVALSGLGPPPGYGGILFSPSPYQSPPLPKSDGACSASGVFLVFDGMSIPLYQFNFNTIVFSGTITLTTRDS